MTTSSVFVEVAHDPREVLLHLAAHDRIERAERLVEQEQRGIEHERAHDADALPLPARELGGEPLEEVSRARGARATELASTRARDLVLGPAEVAARGAPRCRAP